MPGTRRKRSDEADQAEQAGDLPTDIVEALNGTNSSAAVILQAASEVGITRAHAAGLLRRLAVQKSGFRSRLDRLTTREMIAAIEDRLALVLEYIDEFGISGASPKDLAIMFGILVEKRQLLLGEPTQILSVEERKKINELIPALVEEAQRRGMTIDMAPGGYEEVTDERAAPLAHAGRVLPADHDKRIERMADKRMIANPRSGGGMLSRKP